MDFAKLKRIISALSTGYIKGPWVILADIDPCKKEIKGAESNKKGILSDFF